jgi:SAM-dependent methyltransferase
MDKTEDMQRGKSQYVGSSVGGIATRLSVRMRHKMFLKLMALAAPTAETMVLDVGVTCDRREDSNFFEKLYPYPHKLVATGVENASFLEKEIPGVKFVLADGLHLPFEDGYFDLVVSFAVIEHVGDRTAQRDFVQELCRVGKYVCITTPNRWYPIEFHTVLPLVHWLPPQWFRQILRWLKKDFWAKEANLNLLTHRECLRFFSEDFTVENHHFRLFGLTSNLFYFLSRRDRK